ncbi:unnamed protein product [Acanthoscelides obtectus]|uniref:Uncharacterized protein n=1 Tax=Acanthoscelides obtectus TaxID=200917 RepID=A0A9P0KBW3_ACAOB|nr:unnamed protein product [Acanthoscelides obtectus]CAK1640988.1 hypothetical protein AOBTE_LOCUS12061 [Acanthoscelides obtectus]
MSKKKKSKDEEDSQIKKHDIDEKDCLKEENDIKVLKQKIYYLNEMLETKNSIILDKERYINQLVNENRHLQEHYGLIISSIVDKDTIIT